MDILSYAMGKASRGISPSDIETAVNKYLDAHPVQPIPGISIFYGETNTAANVTPKIVTTINRDFVLKKGVRLGVKFINGNTASQTIRVDGSDEIRMVAAHKADGSIDTDTPVTYKPNGQVIWMTYDGEYFIIDQTKRATSDTVGYVTISDSIENASSTTAASLKAVKTLNDKIDSIVGNIETALEALL